MTSTLTVHYSAGDTGRACGSHGGMCAAALTQVTCEDCQRSAPYAAAADPGEHGILTDYATARPVRRATAADLARTEQAQAAGSDAGEWAGDDGRLVYVER